MRMLKIDTIHSPDDGYYAEVYDEEGQEVHKTNVSGSREKARRAASKWISRQVDIPSCRDGKNW